MRSIVRTERGSMLALEPVEAQNMATKIARALEQAVAQPVLLCTPALRPHLWRLFSRCCRKSGSSRTAKFRPTFASRRWRCWIDYGNHSIPRPRRSETR